MEDDILGLERELASEEISVCDICGQPLPRSSFMRVAGDRAVAEPVEYLHVCKNCRDHIVEEEVPFEAEIAAGLQAADE